MFKKVFSKKWTVMTVILSNYKEVFFFIEIKEAKENKDWF